MDTHEVWQDILSYARWSPSPHNVQPWKVKILSATQAQVYYDPKRLLPAEDTTGCFTILGFGIFIEYMAIAANPLGYTIEAVYPNTLLDENASGIVPFAKLNLVKSTKKEVFDRELIRIRQTSRLEYNGRPVAPEIIEELTSIAKEYGHTLSISTDKEMINWVLQLNRDTVFYDMNDKKTREEIAHWLRYSMKSGRQKKDGLWAYCLTIPGILLYLFFHFRWLFNLPGFKQFARSYYLKSTSGTAMVGWLHGPFSTPEDWIKAGHMMGRLWLAMTNRKVYLHPFGSIITNKDAHKRLKEKFNIDESSRKTWLLMRLGYSAKPPQSERLLLDDILIR